MDGGVIEGAILESMMTGAAVGGGSSILQGKDPLQGALLGGLMGGAGGAMFGGAGAAPSGAMPGAAASGEAAFAAQTPTGLNVIPGEAGTQALTQNAAANAATPFTAQTATGLSTLPGEAGIGGIEPAQGMFGRASQAFGNLTDKQKLLAGGAGIAGLGMIRDQMRGGVPKKKPYSGALSQFQFDPSAYRPYSYATGGGIASLGSYSDGGRMLKGPGDGMSDNIPATIGNKQPARLADGEFVVPADVVSHLGNGSTDAGAKQLYSMMNKVRQARTGNAKQGREIQPRKYLPA
jgi:hypothetical protein